jgi:SAM-dependent methyltransferase
MRQAYLVDGVRYREVTVEPLRHALSRKGPGFKDYDATFSDGSTLRIRCTARRVYADLAPSRLAAVCDAAERLLRPGMRILILEGGTGDCGAFVAGRVAPSGAVVSIDRDAESIEFALRRYRNTGSAFEVGGIEGLAGETEGAFRGVIAVEPLAATDNADAVLRELWRVVAPTGWLLVASPPGEQADQAIGRLDAVVDGQQPTILADGKDGWVIAVVMRPAEA